MQQAHLAPLVRDQSRPPSRHYAQGEVRHTALNKNGGLYERGHKSASYTQLLVGILALVFGPVQAARNAWKFGCSSPGPTSASRWRDMLRWSGYTSVTSGANIAGSGRWFQGPRKLSDEHVAFMAIILQPGMFLRDVKARFEAAYPPMTIEESTISRTLSRFGFSIKQSEIRAIEKLTPANLQRIATHRAMQRMPGGLNGKRLINVDEAHFYREDGHRGRAWSMLNKPCREYQKFQSSKDSFTLICAVSYDRVLPCSWILPSGVNNTALLFELWFCFMLLPLVPAGYAIMLDNARIHRRGVLRAMAWTYGVEVFFLPAYSPEYAWIELVFGWVKRHLKYLNCTVDACQFYVLWLLGNMPASIIESFCRHCGYGNV